MMKQDNLIGQHIYSGEELHRLSNVIVGSVAIEKIICFGSHVHEVKSKSCFIEDSKLVHKFKNQYALLVIPLEGESLTHLEISEKIESVCTPIAVVTIIVHTMAEMNLALQKGSSFFSGIYRRGTLLFDRNKISFVEPGSGSSVDIRISKRESYWNKWLSLSESFMEGADFYKQNGRNDLALFMLYQALQHCYAGLLRVYTGYRADKSDLDLLLRLVASVLPNPGFLLAQCTADDERLKGLLLNGFNDSRYKEGFEIDRQGVAVLYDRVGYIIGMAARQCKERIKNLKAGNVSYV